MDGTEMDQAGSRISIVIVSSGRPSCVNDIVRALNAQSCLPDRILLVVPGPADLDLAALEAGPWPLRVRPEALFAPRGICMQRNAGLEALGPDCGLVAFFDDDYLPERRALARIRAAFDRFGPDVVGLTGVLIADGIGGPGIELSEAEGRLAAWEASDANARLGADGGAILEDTVGLYGCNMIYRRAAIGDIRFDEALPLYGWQEDVDFARRVARARSGRLVKTDAFRGLHRGVKSGRDRNGVRLGYSQIVNIHYLWRTGSLPPGFAAKLALRNFAGNHLRVLRSEPWIDRRGRARGNWIGVRDVFSGRAHPMRALEI
ncbi:glycosyltransferase family 2 protein [Roseivivax jejudonensis]|nr:family 2 glycosyl transferase [Roseivivax jejudonensis]